MQSYPRTKGLIQHFRNFGAPVPSARASYRSARRPIRLTALAAGAIAILTGCSTHPIADEVSPIPTEAIVAAARCELRLGLVEQVKVWFADEVPPVTGMDPETIAEHLPEMKRRFPNVDLPGDWDQYMAITSANDWNFEITETNDVTAAAGFKLPFLSGDVGLNTGGSVNVKRYAKRTFKNTDTFGQLLTKKWRDFCNDRDRSVDGFPNTAGPGEPFAPLRRNPVYPITGSIGLARAVTTFLKIAVQEGASEKFTETLKFTTTISANAGMTATLAPAVPKQFRPVSASATLTGSRVDLHQVTISLAFPTAISAQRLSATPPTPAPHDMTGDQRDQRDQRVERILRELETKGGFTLNTNWRAAYALCVTDARTREDEFRLLRLDPPEVTCLASTDAFFPRGDGVTTAVRTGSRQDLLDERRERRVRQRQSQGQPLDEKEQPIVPPPRPTRRPQGVGPRG